MDFSLSLSELRNVKILRTRHLLLVTWTTRYFLPALGIPRGPGEPKSSPPCPSMPGPQPRPRYYSHPLSHWSMLQVAQTLLTNALFRDELTKFSCSHNSLTLSFSSIALITICDLCFF